jgi:hypothetical protein
VEGAGRADYREHSEQGSKAPARCMEKMVAYIHGVTQKGARTSENNLRKHTVANSVRRNLTQTFLDEALRSRRKYWPKYTDRPWRDRKAGVKGPAWPGKGWAVLGMTRPHEESPATHPAALLWGWSPNSSAKTP